MLTYVVNHILKSKKFLPFMFFTDKLQPLQNFQQSRIRILWKEKSIVRYFLKEIIKSPKLFIISSHYGWFRKNSKSDVRSMMKINWEDLRTVLESKEALSPPRRGTAFKTPTPVEM